MTVDQTAIESTLPTEVDELIWELDTLRAPVHITAGNRQLRAELGDVDADDLQAAIRIRKRQLCEACGAGQGRHGEPDGTRVQEFTPGVSNSR